jgi:hypothetical protein
VSFGDGAENSRNALRVWGAAAMNAVRHDTGTVEACYDDSGTSAIDQVAIWMRSLPLIRSTARTVGEDSIHARCRV